jgi:hypothetical protein
MKCSQWKSGGLQAYTTAIEMFQFDIRLNGNLMGLLKAGIARFHTATSLVSRPGERRSEDPAVVTSETAWGRRL